MESVRATTFLLGALLCVPVGDARGQGTPPEAALTLIEASGRRAVPTEIVAGREMIELDEIAAIFGVTIREDTLAGGAIVTVNGQTIALSAGQSLVSVGGRIVALPAPTTNVDGRWLVPIEFLPRALAPVTSNLIDLRLASRLLIVGDIKVPRVTVQLDDVTLFNRVTMDISPTADVISTVEAERILLRIEANAVELVGGAIAGTGLITGISVVEPSIIVVTFSADAVMPVVNSSIVDGSSRITIDLPTSATTTIPPLVTPSVAPPSTSGVIGLGVNDTEFDIIVIDPGHGGDDIGVRGTAGTEEKLITLAVAQQLRTLIETRLGLRVLLTRTSDNTVLLDQRTAIANNNKANLFLSLHVGGAPTESVSGAEVLHVRLGREGENARQRAATAETLPVLGGGNRAIDTIRWELAQAPHAETSTVLANILVEALASRVPMGPRPRQDAPLRLLMGANMPAAIIEMGYLTNPEQENLLRSEPYQGMIAQALYDAIVRFRGYIEARGAE